jgi:flagellar basal-body rod protein FlgB
MYEGLEILRQAQAMSVHAARRQMLIAENVANADTPGFRPRDLPPFAEVWRAMASRELPGPEPRPVPRPLAGSMAPNGNAVSLEVELLGAAEVRAQHDLALAIYRTALGLLRTSLGRPR